MRKKRATKKPSEYGELVPYPFALNRPRRFLRAPSEEKVAGQGLWPEGLAYRSIRIFGCGATLPYTVSLVDLITREYLVNT